MTVRFAMKLYGFVGLPCALLVSALMTRSVGPLWSITPVLAFAIFGAIFLRCPACRRLAGWTRLEGPLKNCFQRTPTPHACTWCGLDFDTAQFRLFRGQNDGGRR